MDHYPVIARLVGAQLGKGFGYGCIKTVCVLLHVRLDELLWQNLLLDLMDIAAEDDVPAFAVIHKVLERWGGAEATFTGQMPRGKALLAGGSHSSVTEGIAKCREGSASNKYNDNWMTVYNMCGVV